MWNEKKYLKDFQSSSVCTQHFADMSLIYLGGREQAQQNTMYNTWAGWIFLWQTPSVSKCSEWL